MVQWSGGTGGGCAMIWVLALCISLPARNSIYVKTLKVVFGLFGQCSEGLFASCLFARLARA